MFKYGSKRHNTWSFQIVPKLDHREGMGVVCVRSHDLMKISKVVTEFKNKSVIKDMIENFEDDEQENPLPIGTKELFLD